MIYKNIGDGWRRPSMALNHSHSIINETGKPLI